MNINIKKGDNDVFVEVSLAGYNGTNRESFNESEALQILEAENLTQLTCVKGVPLDNRHGPSVGTYHFKMATPTTPKISKKQKSPRKIKKQLDNKDKDTVGSS
jgi:hypothetical protein